MGYNGPPDRKRARKLAIEIAQARVDEVLAALIPDDKLLDARLLELAGVLDGTIDPVDYMRPSPPPPLRPTRTFAFIELVQLVEEKLNGPEKKT